MFINEKNGRFGNLHCVGVRRRNQMLRPFQLTHQSAIGLTGVAGPWITAIL